MPNFKKQIKHFIELHMDQNLAEAEDLIIHNLLNSDKLFDDQVLIHYEKFMNFCYLDLIQKERNSVLSMQENQCKSVFYNETTLVDYLNLMDRNANESIKKHKNANGISNLNPIEKKADLDLSKSFSFILDNLTENEIYQKDVFRINLIKYCKNHMEALNKNLLKDFTNLNLDLNNYLNKNENELVLEAFITEKLEEILCANKKFMQDVHKILNSFIGYFDSIADNNDYFANFHHKHSNNYILINEIKEIFYLLKLNFYEIHKATDALYLKFREAKGDLDYAFNKKLNLIFLNYENQIEHFVKDFILEASAKLKVLMDEVNSSDPVL